MCHLPVVVVPDMWYLIWQFVLGPSSMISRSHVTAATLRSLQAAVPMERVPVCLTRTATTVHTAKSPCEYARGLSQAWVLVLDSNHNSNSPNFPQQLHWFFLFFNFYHQDPWTSSEQHIKLC